MKLLEQAVENNNTSLPRRGGQWKIISYKFERNKYFKKYLEAMNEIKFSKIKQLILNRKK